MFTELVLNVCVYSEEYCSEIISLSFQAIATCGESASDYLKGSFKDAEKFIQGGPGPAYADAGTIPLLFFIIPYVILESNKLHCSWRVTSYIALILI